MCSVQLEVERAKEGLHALTFHIPLNAHLMLPIGYRVDQQSVVVSVGIERSIGLDVLTHGSYKVNSFGE